MYRVIEVSGKYYAVEVDIRDEQEQDNLETLTRESVPVIYVGELEELETQFGIEEHEVEIVTQD